MKIKTVFFLLFISLLSTSASSADPDFLWNQVNGTWTVKPDLKILSDTYGKPYQFNYSELINTHSLIGTVPAINAQKIYSSFTITNPKDIGHALLFFAADKSYQKFYAFRFIVDKEGINWIQFVKSDKIDESLPPSVKNNFKITVLSSENVKLNYGVELNIMIIIKGKTATLSVNRNKIMTVTAQDNLSDGLFGFSHKNNTITISQFKIMADDEVLFEDDFSRDRIKRYTATIKKEK
jgi:hypothetical protein